MNATRHRLALAELTGSEGTPRRVRRAEELERHGNWYLAGETYRQIAASIRSASNMEPVVNVLVRAAAAFDIAGQYRVAARAYFDAATILHNAKIELSTAGELFNRSALAFQQVDELFNAGDAWRRAGAAFSEAPFEVITTEDNLPPVPYSGGRFTVAALCSIAAGEAFMRATDQGGWACMAYWEAGRFYAKQELGWPAFGAYKRALLACIHAYATLEGSVLCDRLPLTDDERASSLEPVTVMEQQAELGEARVDIPFASSPTESQIRIQREIAQAFQGFSRAFSDIANMREASLYRAAAKERQRRIFTLEKNWKGASLYKVWSAFSGYGDSLARWAVTCLAVLLLFATLYWVFNLVEPVSNSVDYLYFSVVTFTSLGYGDLHPRGVAGKVAASAEILAGLVMFGLLLTFIGNRVQRS